MDTTRWRILVGTIKTVLLGNYEFKPTLVPTLAFLVLLPVLISLGMWQLNRAEEKRGIERDVIEATEKTPLMINSAESATLVNEVYRPAKMTGHYDSKRQYLWDNKTHQGRPGFQVLTPFLLDDGKRVVMVNRGWIPMLGRRDQYPDISVVESPISIVGVIKNPSNTIQLADRIDQRSVQYPHVVQAFEPLVIASELDLTVMPILLELSPDGANGYVRDWQPYYGKIGKHLGYAAQWFIMALIAVFLYLKLNTRRVDRGLNA